MYLINFINVLYCKLFKNNYDHFLDFKYDKIKKYYGSHCLDVGTGYGNFADFLHSHNHKVIAVDVVNKFRYEHEFRLFDGKNIPLINKTIDTSVIMFVLHHSDEQIELLKDVCRVTKSYIVIGEDVMKSRMDRFLGNIHLNTSPWAKSNNLFHSTNEWIDIFTSLNLELIETVDISRSTYPVYPVSRNIFVLKVVD